MSALMLLLWLGADAPANRELLRARDAQDRAALTRIAQQRTNAAAKSPAAATHYAAALAQSTLAEVAAELRDRDLARKASSDGITEAERAVTADPKSAEYHRIHGTLCGQAAAAVGGLGALKFGKCALDEVNKAIELDPKAAINYLSHGIGNYYLPAALGGGVELAIQDFQKAISLDPKSSDAQLWLGLALRKLNRNEEARKAFQKAVELNPTRLWAMQQLEKTPTP
ncbi:MAG: tetratricopeptide repeat protein [Bryobacteraceae bacterium]